MVIDGESLKWLVKILLSFLFKQNNQRVAFSIIFSALCAAAFYAGTTGEQIGWIPGGECSVNWLTSGALFVGLVFGSIIGNMLTESNNKSHYFALGSAIVIACIAVLSYFWYEHEKQVLVWTFPAAGLPSGTANLITSGEIWKLMHAVDADAIEVKQLIANSVELSYQTECYCDALRMLSAVRVLFAMSAISVMSFLCVKIVSPREPKTRIN